MLNKDKMKSELNAVYKNKWFNNILTTGAFMKFLHGIKFSDTLSEVTKLLEMFLVTPVSTA